MKNKINYNFFKFFKNTITKQTFDNFKKMSLFKFLTLAIIFVFYIFNE